MDPQNNLAIKDLFDETPNDAAPMAAKPVEKAIALAMPEKAPEAALDFNAFVVISM